MAATSAPSTRTAARATRWTSARTRSGDRSPRRRAHPWRLVDARASPAAGAARASGSQSASGAGRAEVEALGVVDAQRRSSATVSRVADELGDRALAEAAGDVDDRLDDELVGAGRRPSGGRTRRRS